jgi:hypothetical protein
MDRAEGWFSAGVHNDEHEKAALAEAIERLPRLTRWQPAFQELAAIVHKASNHMVYVGRTGATVKHLLGRFAHHRENRDGRWIFPVLRVSTDKVRKERWESMAIRWTMARMREGQLCCNNDVADQRGNWPDTEDCLIYVVVCGSPSQ